MAQPAAVESRQACSYDEVDAVRPIESSSIGVDAVFSSSAASQAQLSSATAAETIKKIMDLFLLWCRCRTRMKQFEWRVTH